MCPRISLSWAGIFDFSTLFGAQDVGERDGEPDPTLAGRDARESELSDRLRNLDRKLDQRRASDQANEPPKEQPSSRRFGLALRMGADFVAGVVVGGAIGWGVDRLFGTSPWGLIVFVLLGFAAGILTVLRTAGLAEQGPAGPDDKV
jgi:ATP synthase protein I